MTAVRVIPCLDIKNGRVVKGIHFEGLRDAGDPVDLARHYDSEGADELVFLDITATSDQRKPVVELASRVAECIFIPFTVGGGIRTIEDIAEALQAGADKVSLNTAAIAEPEFIRRAAENFGSQCVVIAIDARRRSTGSPGWDVYSHGGRTNTGLDVIDWVKRVEALGAGEILLTSMDGDGTQAGFDTELLAAVSRSVQIPVIASGGAGTPEHLVDAVTQGKADAVLVASILHDAKVRIRDLKSHMASRGIEVRL
jgi:cyclase